MSDFAEQEKAMETKVRQELLEELKRNNEAVFDPLTAPKIAHNWTKRGIRLVCSSPTHPRHEAFVRMSMNKG